ncbi:hypothetical protein [Hyphococcus luteus]|uniref:Uncharacterized protein n=1 Tax=Hyphococcus luteus TaxID=2058213 RepID=A0A2S7K847_9PROT|nr:hypothetical protein [Marinicaulis flavus]PQA88663.1 hypothetical protein CW354_10325 [Marinicaulis flavus]
MGLIEKKALISQISPPMDHLLATQLVDEFISSERRFIQRDWEPSQLDGGQFAETLARIWYHADSKNLNRGKDFNECLKYIENDQVTHTIQPRQDALHMARVLRTLYKFRSQRGAVHISLNYTPNHMDSKFVIEMVRWCMNDTLRVFWSGDREAVAKAIRELLQFDVPAIGVFGSVTLVQRTDLRVEEEVLLILHFAGENGMSRRDVGKIVLAAPASVTTTLKKLMSKEFRQIVLDENVYRLTDLGSRRVRNELSEKLLAQ